MEKLTGHLAFLPSKTTVPVVPEDAVARPRLTTRLNELTEACKVVAVTAPAGFGKTVLVSSWAHRRKRPVAWLALDSADAALDRFCAYLAESLRVAGILPEELPEAVPSDEAQATRFLEGILVRLEEASSGVDIVLEDFHAVVDDAAVFRSFVHFASHLPASVCLVVTSRAPFRKGFSRMKVEGAFGELTERDLALTVHELSSVCIRLGKGLGDAETARLADVSGGWPIAVKLALLADRQGDRSLPAEGTADALLADYLLDEVIAGLPESIKDFVKTTSLVGAFSFSLAKELTGWSSARVSETIEFVVDNGLFVTEIRREDGVWFKYHALFARSVARACGRDEELVASVHRAASRWFERSGLHDEAIAQAAEAKDWDGVASIVSAHWQQLYADDALPRLGRWIALLPERYLVSHPRMLILQILPLAVSGRFEQAEANVQRALEMTKGQEDGLYATLLAVSGIAYSLMGDVKRASAFSQRALGLLGSNEGFLRSIAGQVASGVLIGEDLERAREGFQQSLSSRAGAESALAVSAHANLAFVCALMGNLSEADRHAEKAEQIAGGYDPQAPMLVVAFAGRALAAWCRGEEDRCTQACGFVFAHEEECRVPFTIDLVRMCAAFQEAGRGGDPSRQVATVIDECPEAAVRAYPPLPLLRRWNDAGLFDRWRTEYDREVAFSKGYHAEWVTWASRYLLGDASGVAAVGEYEASVPDRLIFDKLNALVLHALFEEAEGSVERAEECLRRAFELAEPEGFVQPFFGNRDCLAPLWKRIADALPESYGGALYRRVRSVSVRLATSKDEGALTARELEVARCAAHGLSNQQIGEALHITRETVKKHLASIYLKTETHSRLQAVNALREAGILDGDARR